MRSQVGTIYSIRHQKVTFMFIQKQERCSVTETLKLLSAKWKPCIISYLMHGEKRYGELLKLIPNINKKMLTQHLKDLEDHGLINRDSYPVIPPKVVYSLSEKGEKLVPLMYEIERWGLTNLEGTKPIAEMVSVPLPEYHLRAVE